VNSYYINYIIDVDLTENTLEDEISGMDSFVDYTITSKFKTTDKLFNKMNSIE
jgi:hypothetical protein